MRIARKASVVVASAAAVALTACSGGGGGASTGEPLDTEEEISINLAWWGDDTRAALYEEAVELFEEEHPNIDVTTTFVAWDDYWTARNTEAASGTLPDVMQMDLSYLRQYGNNGQLLDLTDEFDVNLDVSGLDEALLTAGAVEGAQLGIPTSTNTLALFYNADVVEQIGMEPLEEGYTWDDLNDWIIEATEKGAGEDPAVYGGSDYAGALWFLMQWLIQQGIEPFTADGQLNFSEEDTAAFLESTAELRDSDAVYPIEQTKQIEPLTGFQVSAQAAEITWDNFMAGYVAETEQNIEMLPMPSGDNGPQQFWKPSMLLAASANTDQPAAAATLIDFLINEPAVGEIFGTSKGVPSTAAQRDAMALEAGSVDEEVTQYEEDVADLVTESAPLPVEGFGAIEAEWKRLHEELLYGTVTVDEFVEQWFAFAEDTIPAAG